MRKILWTCLCLLTVMFGWGAPAASAYDMKPVAFVVLDHTDQVTATVYREWRQQVKQAYYAPNYIVENNDNFGMQASEVIDKTGKSTSKLERADLRAIAEATGTQVVALVAVNRMEEVPLMMMHSPWDDDNSDWVRVYTSADIYLYKYAEDKMLKKHIRDVDTKETPNVTHPETLIKWELRKVANTMENRPQI